MSKSKGKKNDGIRNLDIGFFLQTVCGIHHSDTRKMTHKAVSTFFPQLKRTSFDHISKNPELLRTGKVVLVRDVEFHSAPYLVPQELIMTNEGAFLTKEEQLTEIIQAFKTISTLSEDALLLVEATELLDNYLANPELVPNTYSSKALAIRLREASSRKRGLVLSTAGNIYRYEDLLEHGNMLTEGSTSLERQATSITSLTDTYALLIEGSNEVKFVSDGQIYSELNIEDITEMMNIFYLGLVTDTADDTIVKDIHNYSLSTMPNYELITLMKYYKMSGQQAYYHAVRRELTARTSPTKKYKEKKEIQKTKEREDS